MAKVTQGAFGSFIGKFINAVGFKWKGLFISRALVTPANPRTAAQQLHRAKFGYLGRLASQLSAAITEGLHHSAQSEKSTEIGKFMKLNFPALTGTDPDNVALNLQTIILSEGNTPNPDFGATSFETPQAASVEIKESGLSRPKASSTDRIVLVAYCEGQKDCALGYGSRNDENVSVSLPQGWQGQEVMLYAFTVATTGNRRGVASSTIYCGKGTAA